MNQYLKSAASRYKELLPKNKKEDGYLINPISEVDCEIIIELSELLRKVGHQEVVAILKEYKGTIKDVEIRDRLIQCNIDTKDKGLDKLAEKIFGEIVDNNPTQSYKRNFITIGDERIEAKLIYGYGLIDRSKGEEEQYDIVLNPCKFDATRLPLYANTYFTFYDYEEVMGVMNMIDEQMEQSNVNFINKEKEEDGD